MRTVDKIAELQTRRQNIVNGDSSKIKKLHDQKKLTARERISYLFDEGSFIETDAFVQNRYKETGLKQADALAEGVITGYGTVDGRLVYAYSQDITVLDGSVGEMHSKKILKIMEMAKKMGAPVVAVCDSEGARIQEGVSALSGYAKIISQSVMLSGVIPQITAVMGYCAGAEAFIPAMSDFVVMVDKNAKMFMTGPSVLSSLYDKKITDEDIADAVVHSKKTGTAHFNASSDEECIDCVKKLLSYLPSNNLEDSPYIDTNDDINRVSDALNDIITDNSENVYDVKSIISQIVDNGELFEVQKDYAENIVVGFARLNGSTIGIVANQALVLNGAIDINASDKAAKFIRFCDCFNIPLLTFTDTCGYAQCEKQEQNGIIRHSAKLIYAYTEATVPKVNVIIGKAYGSAYITMCSKDSGADFVYAWPTAQISVMDPAGAANLVFADELSKSSNPVNDREKLIEKYRDEYANPYEGAKLGLVDDIIEPNATRPQVIAAFEMLLSKREQRPGKKHGNIPM